MNFPRLSHPLVVALMSTIGLIACSEQKQQTLEIIPPMVKLIDVGDIMQKSMRQFPAVVEASTDSHLAFRVSGEIEYFKVKAGNRVNKGDILAQLDATDFEISVSDRQARYTLALSQFNRTSELLNRNLVSQSAFDEAQANLLVATSNLKSAKTAFEYTTLRAPYDGIVARVHVEKHQNIQGQQLILDMQNLDSVDVSIQMPERLVAMIDKDTSYQPDVTFDSVPNKRYRLSVKEWDTQANPVTRTFKIVFTMPVSAGMSILPGMSGSVFVDLAKVTNENFSHIVLPVAAVFSAEDKPSDHDKQYVWVVNEQLKVTRKAVTVGELTAQGIVIEDGLSENEIIVGAGVHYLSEGMTVRAWQRERGL